MTTIPAASFIFSKSSSCGKTIGFGFIREGSDFPFKVRFELKKGTSEINSRVKLVVLEGNEDVC